MTMSVIRISKHKQVLYKVFCFIERLVSDPKILYTSPLTDSRMRSQLEETEKDEIFFHENWEEERGLQIVTTELPSSLFGTPET